MLIDSDSFDGDPGQEDMTLVASLERIADLLSKCLDALVAGVSVLIFIAVLLLVELIGRHT